MPRSIEFTGERFLPGLAGEIAHEHWHRYAFARRIVEGRRVLDVACGEGYGTAALAEVARQALGIDIDGETIAHAIAAYATRPNLRFVVGSAAALPLADGSVEAIVSFETIEHLDAAGQARMIEEFGRVLSPDGVLVISSPNRPEYSERRGYANPFHRSELDRFELARLLGSAFPAQRWYRQRRYLGSALWGEDTGSGLEAWSGNEAGVGVAQVPPAMYFVVVAARSAAALPRLDVALSLFADAEDREWQRIDAQAREVLRLDALLRDRDAALDRQTAHVLHLEALVAERDRRLLELDALRDAQRGTIEALEAKAATLEEDARGLERAIGAQERIIAYRQSARWWVALPWVRIRQWWRGIAGS